MAESDDDAIRRLRLAYNDAIRRRDLDAIGGFLLPQYTVLPGSIGVPKSRAEALAIFAAAFDDPEFLTYVRETKVAVVSTARKRAAEVGAWRGSWRARDLAGIYQAVWLPVEGNWRLLNESFVTLED